MSYARFSEGDVYLFAHADFGGWLCQGCGLPEDHEKRFGGEHSCWLVTASEVLEHLEAHIEAGHDVPERAVRRIEKEIAEHGEDWCYEHQPFHE